MKTAAKSLCIGCTAILMTSGTAWAQEACKPYTVVAGDNLRIIARKAYGNGDLYRVIYGANVDTIGAKADLIEIGAILAIPCDPQNPAEVAAAPSKALQTSVVDPAKQPVQIVPELPVAAVGTAAAVAIAAAPEAVAPLAVAPLAVAPEAPPPEEAAADVPAPVAATPETVAPVPAPSIRMVTGNGYAPFADEMLPGGGMFTQLVEMALFRADPALPYNLTFISDWQAHIDALLPSGAYDLSFPWIRPECETTMLAPGDLARCENFVFSAPFYEIVDGFFVLADSDLLGATDYSMFQGKRICRPEGFTTGVLEEAGLTAATVVLTRPIEVKDCFEALAAGTVDLVSIDAEVGDSAIAELGLVGDFAQNPHLMALQSLHVVAHKSNLRAVEMVKQLDKGIIEMYESGEWYDIVSTALARNAALQQ